jgi:hypothetical protein
MPGFDEHRVRRLVVALSYSDERNAFAVRRRLAEWVRSQAVPALQAAFDTFAEGREVHIDRLELDLGEIPLSAFDESRSMTGLLLEQLRTQLPLAAGAGAKTGDRAMDLADVLAVFLDTGGWPWDAPVRGPDEAERALLGLSNQEGRRPALRLLGVLGKAEARRRFAHQLSAGLAEWLFGHTHGTDTLAALQSARETLGEPRQTPGDMRPLAGATASLALLTIATSVEPGHALSREEATRLWQAALPPTSLAPSPSQGSPGEERTQAMGLEAQVDDMREGMDGQASGDEGLYVRGAGIVLLHPFLPRFFAALALLDDRQQFVSLDAQVRAVHVLHHLATGGENPPEPETLLYKFLCGMPLTRVVPRQLSLSALEREEADNLLSAVIRHWSRLGNTTPAGLRETFLQREGKLIQAYGEGAASPARRSARLIVEQRGVDVLLDSVPWGLSLVQLPWQAARLTVDWSP